MARIRDLTAAAACAAVVFGCDDGPFGPRSETFSWSGELGVGQQLEIKGVNGDITASRAAGRVANVSVVKRGRGDDPADVRIEVVAHAGGVTICAVYPDVSGEPPNECTPGSGGRMSTRDNDVEVTFTVTVPAGVDFVAQTVNGEIEGRNLASDGFATTVNGDIELTTTTLATASTVNGSVTATIGSPDWDRDLHFTTVNGNVTVEVPSDTNAEARLSTVNGDVSCEFDLTEASEDLLFGRIGEGGPRLTLTAVNGNVRLERGP